MKRWISAAAPNVGYGLTVLATLFLGNIALLLATLPNPQAAAVGHLTEVLAFAILGSLAGSGCSVCRCRAGWPRSHSR
jgi:hypothetical protein